MKNKKDIHVGFCVAYDWALLAYSLPAVYEHAHSIFISVDIERISWAGNPFSWDEEGFRALITSLDPQQKIVIVEDDYHLPHLKPMENEVRQRNKLGEAMGKKCWHIQLDTDEFFINFKGFVSFLQQMNFRRKVNVSCPWITLYKQDAEGFYYVCPEKYEQVEFIQVATLHPQYEYGRRNGNFNVHTDFALLHLSWARSEAEIWEKINNWGHKNDFDVQSYYNNWLKLNRNNFNEFRNFHYMKGGLWPKLQFVPAKDTAGLLQDAVRELQLPISKNRLKLENSIWYSRAKKYFLRNQLAII